jgi:NTP pyrophosphatase (non-canonical NTP hydrolase)
MNDLRKISKAHYKWIKKMGWNKLRPLESLALICSEVGEAAQECRGKKLSPLLGSELSDIILRTLAMAEQNNIDIVSEINKKMIVNRQKGNKGRIK